MILPRHSLIVFTAGILFLQSGFAMSAGKEPQPGSALPSAGDESASAARARTPGETVLIPGPLRSFMRMTGISQEISSEEIMPMLARNISLWGYEGDKPTEFLKLAEHYVQLARELQKFAGPDGKIRVKDCDDAGKLIEVLGYQFAHGCSPNDASLITADPERAFRDLLEARDHPECRCLPTPRGADENHELAVGDGEIDVVDGARAVGVDLADPVERDLRHAFPLVSGSLKNQTAPILRPLPRFTQPASPRASRCVADA